MNMAATDARLKPGTIARRRILVAPSEYPDINDGLIVNGNWAEEQTRALSSYHDVAVVYPLLTTEKCNGIEDLSYYGVRTLIVKYQHVRKTWVSPYVFAMWRGVKHASSYIKPECIHAHGLYPAGFAAVLIGRKLGIPTVITEHWGRLEERIAEGRLIGAVLKFTLRYATQMIAVSEFSAAEMRRVEMRCSPVVVSNVVAPIFFKSRPAFQCSEKGGANLLFVGSIRDYRKGLDVLLRALRSYSDLPGAHKWRLKIIGEGGKRSELDELADRLKLKDHCEFLGNRSREQVAEEMAACDLFVMPSRYETFGVVYAEAMACGKPVIACRGGPAEEIVPPWAGELVTPGDVESLARAIGHVVSKLRGYDAPRISDYARQRFGSEAVIAALSEVYERAIENSGKSGK